MAFSIGYEGLCEKNIKHIYTSLIIKPPTKRRNLAYKPEFLKEFDRQRRERLNNRRFMEYLPDHDIELPRAPAFRGVKKGEISEIVKRLTMSSRDRFHFQHPTCHVDYNDWRTAHEEKIQRMRDTLNKFGGRQRNMRLEPIHDMKGHKKDKHNRKERKGKPENGLVIAEEEDKLPDITG